MSNFRKIALNKIAKTSGILTDFISKVLNVKQKDDEKDIPSGFKAKFLALSAGPAREKLVYDEVIKHKPTNLIPVTITGPKGVKITYKVMSDYITIDGLRVTMAGSTAQKVADHWNMHLPTTKMVKQMWEASDIKIRPTPLSAGGRIGGKYYSGKEVVSGKISDSDSAVAYSEMIDEELSKHDNNDQKLKSGYMKNITAPVGDPSKLGLFGWFDSKGNPIQANTQTPHDTKIHTEYGTGTQLAADDVTITLPSGKVVHTTMEKLRNHPELSKAVSSTVGIKKYNT